MGTFWHLETEVYDIETVEKAVSTENIEFQEKALMPWVTRSNLFANEHEWLE